MKEELIIRKLYREFRGNGFCPTYALELARFCAEIGLY